MAFTLLLRLLTEPRNAYITNFSQIRKSLDKLIELSWPLQMEGKKLILSVVPCRSYSRRRGLAGDEVESS